LSLEKIAWEIKYFVDINDVIEKLNDKHQKNMKAKVDIELQKKVLQGTGTVNLEALKPQVLEEMRAAMMEEVQAEWDRLIESSPRLKAVLQDVFQELVEYFLGIFKIFYHPHGRELIFIANDPRKELLRLT
jgi:phosphoenolpyruvate carboxylase